jgi:hypothetical protein
MRKFIAVHCLLVGLYLNAETVSLDAAEPIAVTIDANQRRPEINPFIYGQFIEHLGRCIYGGIWAEMLEDRKFYFPVVEDYDPYKSLEDTDFPVVGASPWQIIGDSSGVTMDSSKPFVGDHTPRIAAGHPPARPRRPRRQEVSRLHLAQGRRGRRGTGGGLPRLRRRR